MLTLIVTWWQIVLMAEFPSGGSVQQQFVKSKGVEKILGDVKPSLLLDPCPFVVNPIRHYRTGNVSWENCQSNLAERMVLQLPFKKALVSPFLKQTFCFSHLGSLMMVSTLPLVDKVLELVVAVQLQDFLEEMDFLDLFLSGFRLAFKTDTCFGHPG